MLNIEDTFSPLPAHTCNTALFTQVILVPVAPVLDYTSFKNFEAMQVWGNLLQEKWLTLIKPYVW